MRVQPVSHQPVLSIACSKGEAPSFNHLYGNSSLQSMGRAGKPIGRAFLQLFENVAYLLLLPLYIYTFFIASVSIIWMPIIVVVTPFLLIQDFFREILHTFLPWIFPDPHYRL